MLTKMTIIKLKNKQMKLIVYSTTNTSINRNIRRLYKQSFMSYKDYTTISLSPKQTYSSEAHYIVYTVEYDQP